MRAASTLRLLQRRQRLGLVAAILVVAAVAAGIARFLGDQRRGVQVVNVLGRQRANSQRIAKLVLLISRADSPVLRGRLAGELASVAAQMRRTIDRLPGNPEPVTGYLPLHRSPLTDSLALEANRRARELLTLADSAAKAAEQSAGTAELERLAARVLMLEPLLYERVDRLVATQEEATEEAITRAIWIVVLCGVLGVGAAVVQGIFVVQPAVRELDGALVEAGNARASLERQLAALEVLASDVPVGIYQTDARGGCTFVNRQYCEITGLTSEAALGDGWIAALHPDDRDRVFAAWALAERQQTPFDEVYRFRRPDGTVRTVAGRAQQVRDPDGTVRGIIGSVTDITERDAAAAALREREHRLLEVQEVALLGYWRLDATTLQQHWSPVLFDIFECPRDAVLPPVPEIIARYHPDDQRTLGEVVNCALADGTPWLRDFRIVMADGRVKHLETRGWPVRRADGSVECVTGTVMDITKRKQAELALRAMAAEANENGEVAVRQAEELSRLAEDLDAARRTAEASARLKSEFLANMSHEIRTPMNAIIGFSDLLLDMELGSAQRDFVQTIQRAGQNLLGIINDILDFSKIEAGQFQLDPHPFDLGRELADVRELLAARAVEQGIGLHLRVAPGLPMRLVGDAGRLRQVLLNLVGNAVKFTPQGHVTLAAEGTRTADGEAAVRLSVIDTGIGIPEDAQQRIFEKFTQAEGGTARRFGGTGLGLAICRELVRLMGGTIGVRSRPGEGSEFWVALTLPIDAAADAGPIVDLAPAPEAERSVAGGLRVLVVDDNLANRELAVAILRRCGALATTAADGLEALDVLARESVDLVLMDCHMPNLDGFDTTRRLREEEAATGRPRLPVIALTASVLDEDRRHCTEAGMDDFLAKPVRLAELAAVLQRWREQLGTARSA